MPQIAKYFTKLLLMRNISQNTVSRMRIHDRELNRKINHIHERFLRIDDKDYSSSFNDLLKKDKSVCIHHENIQSLTTELFKMKETFPMQ